MAPNKRVHLMRFRVISRPHFRVQDHIWFSMSKASGCAHTYGATRRNSPSQMGSYPPLGLLTEHRSMAGGNNKSFPHHLPGLCMWSNKYHEPRRQTMCTIPHVAAAFFCSCDHLTLARDKHRHRLYCQITHTPFFSLIFFPLFVYICATVPSPK